MSVMVYIASPYTLGSQIRNVRISIVAAEKLRSLGYLPYLPLMDHFWEFLFPHSYSYWMDMDLEWLTRADCVLRLPGESSGADNEEREAKRLGIPVYYSVNELVENERMHDD